MSERSQLDDVTSEHVRRAVESLSEEFDEPSETIERVMNDSIAQLAGQAEVNDFIATLAHRFTRERLKAMGRAHGAPDVPSETVGGRIGRRGHGRARRGPRRGVREAAHPEVLAAADIVVTMGKSVGMVEIPEGTAHLDWRVGDPTGASRDETRRVRDDIDRRA